MFFENGPKWPESNLHIPKVIAKWVRGAQRYPKLGPMWLQIDPKVARRWPQSVPKWTRSEPKVSQSEPKALSKRVQGDRKSHSYAQSDPNIAQSRPQMPRLTPNIPQSDPDVVPKSHESFKCGFTFFPNTCKSQSFDASKCFDGNREAKSMQEQIQMQMQTFARKCRWHLIRATDGMSIDR